MSRPDRRVIIPDTGILGLQLCSVLITAFGAYPFFEQMRFGSNVAVLVSIGLTIGLSITFVESLTGFFSRKGFAGRARYALIACICVLYSSGLGYAYAYFSMNQAELIDKAKQQIGDEIRTIGATCASVAKGARAARQMELKNGRFSGAVMAGQPVHNLLTEALTLIEGRNCSDAQKKISEINSIIPKYKGTDGNGPTAKYLFEIAGKADQAHHGLGDLNKWQERLSKIPSDGGASAFLQVVKVAREFRAETSINLATEFAQDPFSFSFTQLVKAVSGNQNQMKDYIVVLVALLIAAVFDILSVALSYIREKQNPTIGVFQNIFGHIVHFKSLQQQAIQDIGGRHLAKTLVGEKEKRENALHRSQHVNRRFVSDQAIRSRISTA